MQAGAGASRAIRGDAQASVSSGREREAGGAGTLRPLRGGVVFASLFHGFRSPAANSTRGYNP